MKKAIIIMMMLIMCGICLAHDPNSLPVDKNVRLSINNAGIMTIDIRLTAEEKFVYDRSSVTEIIKSIKAILSARVKLYRKNWLKTQKTTDMK